MQVHSTLSPASAKNIAAPTTSQTQNGLYNEVNINHIGSVDMASSDQFSSIHTFFEKKDQGSKVD